MFVCHVKHFIGDGWQERESLVRQVAGRQWNSAMSGRGLRELVWECGSLSEAVLMRDAILSKVQDVTAEAREP